LILLLLSGEILDSVRCLRYNGTEIFSRALRKTWPVSAPSVVKE